MNKLAVKEKNHADAIEEVQREFQILISNIFFMKKVIRQERVT